MTPLTKPVTRRTSTPASTYGADARRLIAVTVIPGGSSDDLIELRPVRTKRGKAITVRDLWSLLQKIEANRAWGERMAAKKKAKADKLERARLLRSVRSNSHA